MWGVRFAYIYIQFRVCVKLNGENIIQLNSQVKEALTVIMYHMHMAGTVPFFVPSLLASPGPLAFDLGLSLRGKYAPAGSWPGAKLLLTT